MTPRATLRLQLHASFTFEQAQARLADYAALGISHLYLSPITQALPDSAHGYNVIDHGAISAELGGEDGFRELARAAAGRRMGIILDIVPNHMAANALNPWWRDVLQHGQASQYAGYFDIDWRAGKLLLPVLSLPYAEALKRGEVRYLAGSHEIAVAGQTLPLAPGSAQAPEGDSAALDAMLQQQPYRLAWWREASRSLNWRRFFDINELVALRVENPAVFKASHERVLGLYGEGLLDGLRIDHVDGLASPGAYLRRLRAAMLAAAPLRRPWLVVEKILAPQETLDARWPVEGTSGYDFMDEVGALLHDRAARRPLAALWRELGGPAQTPAAQLRAVRAGLLDSHFASERDALLRALPEVAPAALKAWLSGFPVYRSYAEDGGASGQDQSVWRQADRRAARQLPAAGALPLSAALNSLPADSEGLRRLQQLTPPLAAKSLEDTLHYRYMPLLSRNEVGAWPLRFSLDAQGFHRCNLRRQSRYPTGLLATATHDHKRGEDARARLAVVSEIPGLWREQAMAWDACRLPGVHALDHYALLQTLVGAWPADWPAEAGLLDQTALQSWLERIAGWQRKALREGKMRSAWSEPDCAYEGRAAAVLERLQSPGPERELLCRIAAPLVGPGLINSLTQTLLRCTCPGVPDLYQASATWDFSLVDPDNRRVADPFPHGRDQRPGSGPASWQDGSVKLHLLRAALGLRARQPAVFEGEYLPLQAQGPQAAHVLAFLRRDGDAQALVAVPRLCAMQLAGYAMGEAAQARQFWRGTSLPLPQGQWHSALDGSAFAGGAIELESLCSEWPVALAYAHPCAISSPGAASQ